MFRILLSLHLYHESQVKVDNIRTKEEGFFRRSWIKIPVIIPVMNSRNLNFLQDILFYSFFKIKINHLKSKEFT